MCRGRDIAGFLLTVFRGFIADSNSSGANNIMFLLVGGRGFVVSEMVPINSRIVVSFLLLAETETLALTVSGRKLGMPPFTINKQQLM